LRRLYVALQELDNFVFHNLKLPHTTALVGAAAGCNLLILILKKQDQKIAASFHSTAPTCFYRGEKKRPDFVRAFSLDAKV
jgi:hypothetical protein